MQKDENINVEYKRELTDDIKKEIIAFLNTEGGIIGSIKSFKVL